MKLGGSLVKIRGKKTLTLEKLCKFLSVTSVLGSPTWFPFLGREVYSIVLASRDNEEILVHAFAQVRQARN